MTYETYRMLFMMGAIAAAVMLTLSVMLFFLLHIPAVIGYITGRTARKAVESMQSETGKGMTSGNIRRRAVSSRAEQVKTTAEIHRYANLPGNTIKDTTDLTPRSELYADDVEDGGISDTSDLAAFERARILDTTDLSEYEDATDSFHIEYEITYIHTNEIIQ